MKFRMVDMIHFWITNKLRMAKNILIFTEIKQLINMSERM